MKTNLKALQTYIGFGLSFVPFGFADISLNPGDTCCDINEGTTYFKGRGLQVESCGLKCKNKSGYQDLVFVHDPLNPGDLCNINGCLEVNSAHVTICSAQGIIVGSGGCFSGMEEITLSGQKTGNIDIRALNRGPGGKINLKLNVISCPVYTASASKDLNQYKKSKKKGTSGKRGVDIVYDSTAPAVVVAPPSPAVPVPQNPVPPTVNQQQSLSVLIAGGVHLRRAPVAGAPVPAVVPKPQQPGQPAVGAQKNVPGAGAKNKQGNKPLANLGPVVPKQPVGKRVKRLLPPTPQKKQGQAPVPPAAGAPVQNLGQAVVPNNPQQPVGVVNQQAGHPVQPQMAQVNAFPPVQPVQVNLPQPQQALLIPAPVVAPVAQAPVANRPVAVASEEPSYMKQGVDTLDRMNEQLEKRDVLDVPVLSEEGIAVEKMEVPNVNPSTSTASMPTVKDSVNDGLVDMNFSDTSASTADISEVRVESSYDYFGEDVPMVGYESEPTPLTEKPREVMQQRTPTPEVRENNESGEMIAERQRSSSAPESLSLNGKAMQPSSEEQTKGPGPLTNLVNLTGEFFSEELWQEMTEVAGVQNTEALSNA